MKRRVVLIFLFLLFCFPVFSYNMTTNIGEYLYIPSITVSPSYYGAIPTADYLQINNVPIRTQFAVNIDLNVLSFKFKKLEIRNSLSTKFVSFSLAYNQTALKSFISIGLKSSLLYDINPSYKLGFGLSWNFNTFYPNVGVHFASLGFHNINEIKISETPWFDWFISTGVNIDYRKDIIALNIPIGITLVYKGIWNMGD